MRLLFTLLIVSLSIQQKSYCQFVEKDSLFYYATKKVNLYPFEFLDSNNIRDYLHFGSDILIAKSKNIHFSKQSWNNEWSSNEIVVKKNNLIKSISYSMDKGMVVSQMSIKLKRRLSEEDFSKIIVQLYPNSKSNSKKHFYTERHLIYYNEGYNNEPFIICISPSHTGIVNEFSDFDEVGIISLDRNYNSEVINYSTSFSSQILLGYEVKNEKKRFLFKGEYSGDEWCFIDQVEFKFDNDPPIKITVKSDRNVESIFGRAYCKENFLIEIPKHIVEDVAMGRKFKIRVAGSKSNFIISPEDWMIYNSKVMLHYYTKKNINGL